jgi:hypothetical protein
VNVIKWTELTTATAKAAATSAARAQLATTLPALWQQQMLHQQQMVLLDHAATARFSLSTAVAIDYITIQSTYGCIDCTASCLAAARRTL